jgi:hypothetical protein
VDVGPWRAGRHTIAQGTLGWAAAAITLLLSGCGSVSALAPAPPLTIAGTVRDAGGPVVGARIQLTAYQDAHCIAVAQSAAPPSAPERQALRECARPGGEAVSDDAGRYTFANVRPGAYDLTITWALRPGQAVPAEPIFQQGAYAIVIVRNRDGTWTITARSEIVALPDQWSTIQDFTFRSPGPP